MTSPAPTEERKAQEIAFHDLRERDQATMSADDFDRKYPNLRVYSVVGSSRAFVERWLSTVGTETRLLDFCCGEGAWTLTGASLGAISLGVDISAESIRVGASRAKERKLSERCHFAVADVEELPFPNASFDMIICSGVLHHLDLDRAYAEIARVLRPGGRVLCIEALAHNPLIAWYRRRTPHLRTPWEIDHILSVEDALRAKRYFAHVELQFFHLFVIAAVPFRKTRVFRPLYRALDAVDRVVLRVPGVRRMAWQVIFELSHRVTA